MGDAATYRDLGEAAWAWTLHHVHDDDGPWLPEIVTGDAPQPAADRDTVYAGIGGLAPVLAELRLHRPLTAAETALADGIVARLAAQAETRVEPSLYDGLAGDATALRLLAPGREQVALDRLARLRTPDGWPTTFDIRPDSRAPLTDVVMGSAGVVHAATWTGAATLMTAGGEALLRAAEPTAAGLDWRMWPGYRSSSPNFSHGTAGVAAALAVAGHALGRTDFVEAARLGAEHVLAVGDLSGGGFVVPHTIPPSQREVEPVTYNWCHGPAGTSQLFPALALAGVRQVGGHDVAELRRRCLRSVLTSGLPARLRPGFWDNDGRCCGTAGVGDILLDAAQDAAWSCGPAPDGSLAAGASEAAEPLLAGARTMAGALADRALHDERGACWRFIEHREDPPLLPPRTTWMQGTAGIAAFLLRLARVEQDGLTAPVVDRPDQWWAVPAGLRLSTARR
ncbi:lanthionine synthetase LanC family protein [Dactylosporangium sp. NPDC050688]|uniref:lanthionine synthetase LanC family protein n=1 Tax=Dactylosporangium sp. NPDC050688 TaxID=3157217 RepID=UPI003405C9EB